MTDTKKVTIVDVINLASISSLVPLSKKYPELKVLISSSKNNDPIKAWDFFMTAAGAGIVLGSTEKYRGEHKETKNRLNKIDKMLPSAVDDFLSFINNYEDKETAKVGVGLWVLWNVKGAEPSYKEMRRLPLTILNFLMEIILDWEAGKR